MKVEDTSLADVKIITPKVFSDPRGFFMETFRKDWFSKNVQAAEFVQTNHSCSYKGILRGLHYQVNEPQGKLVRVISGTVYDVAVDLRRTSSSFGKWFGTILSEENKKQLWVPEGFAHGFYVLSDTAEFVYKCTNYYSPKHERCIKWNDPDINIEWPLDNKKSPKLSNKDLMGVLFKEAEFFE